MHKHTCLGCTEVIEVGEFDCEFDEDHDFAYHSEICYAETMNRRTTMKKGFLENNQDGEFILREFGMPLPGHDVRNCDCGCTDSKEVAGFRPTNALLIAISRARELGYQDVNNEW